MKKMIISSSKLKQAFSKIGEVVEGNPTLPILKNIFCRVTPGQAELITTNTEITIFYRIQCESKTSFDFLVTYHLLKSIVGLIGDCPITIEAGKVVTISTDTDNFEIKVGEKIAQYPKLPDVPKKTSFVIEENILHSLSTAVTTCSKKVDSKLRYVLMDLTPGKVTVASADGTFVVYSREFNADQQNVEELLISQTVIKVLQGIEKATLFFHSRSIAFETEQITIIATRSEERFVNFRTAFPAEWPANMQLNKSDLMRAINKCLLSSDELYTTTISIGSDEMKLDADDQYLDIHTTCACTYSGKVEKTKVNSERLSTLLKQIEHQDIELAIHDQNRAIVITSTEDLGYKALIMPISLPKQ